MRTLPLLLLACGTAAAAGPDYLPLYPGSRWVYRCSGTTCPQDVPPLEALRSAEAGGRIYSVVRWFSRQEAWLRVDDAGALWHYDPQTRQERRWYAFQTAEGQGYETSIDPCSPAARVSSRAFRYQGPLGSFDNALQIAYPPGGCADAGLTEEIFAPNIGLLRRSETTIGGPRTFELVYARIGNATEYAGAQAAFALALDRIVYATNQISQMTARLTLRNTTSEPLVLHFSSGQIYDLAIRNERSDTLLRWSEDKGFTQALQDITVAPGTEKNFVILMPLSGRGGAPLPQGSYSAEAWLTTMGQRAYSASAGFEIRPEF